MSKFTGRISTIQKIRKWRKGEMEGEKLVQPLIEMNFITMDYPMSTTNGKIIANIYRRGIIARNNGKSGDVANNINFISSNFQRDNPIRIEVFKDKIESLLGGIIISCYDVHRKFYSTSPKEDRYLDFDEYLTIDCDNLFPKGKGTLIVEYESKAGSKYHAAISVKRIEKKYGDDEVTTDWKIIKEKSHNGKLIGKTIFSKNNKKCDICPYEDIMLQL